MTGTPSKKATKENNPYLEGTRDEFITENAKLVTYICKKEFSPELVYQRVGVMADMEDLFSVGVIGLIKAYDRFDPSKFETPIRFSTYAYPMILGEIKRFLRDSNNGVKKSRSDKELYIKIVSSGLIEETPEVIAETLDTTVEKVNRALKSGSIKITSFETEIQGYNRGGSPLKIADTLSDEFRVDPSIVSILTEFLDSLPKSLCDIAILYYKQGYSQMELSSYLGVSQAHISRSLKKIQDLAVKYNTEEKEEGTTMPTRSTTKGEEAKRLLRETNLTVTEISKITGLASSSVSWHKKRIQEDKEKQDTPKDTKKATVTKTVQPSTNPKEDKPPKKVV